MQSDNWQASASSIVIRRLLAGVSLVGLISVQFCRPWNGVGVNLSKLRRAASVAAMVLLAAAVPANAASAIPCPSQTCRLVASGMDQGFGAAEFAGKAYVGYMNGQLRKVDIATGSSAVLASGLGNLRGVAADTTGVYVADWNGRVLRVDAASGAAQVIASGLTHLQGVTRHNGVTYTVGGNTLWRVDSGAQAVTTGFWMAMDVAIDGDRAVVADLGGPIRQVDLATGKVSTLVSGFYEPTHIAVTDNGTIYFMEAASILHRIEAGSTQERTVGDLRDVSVSDFSLDRFGKALITDYSSGGRLWRMTV
ncbi:hypothetical protein [Actinocrispum sp. NPDC049592]|uniref:hypothetical protein n=1 Tax=Actinocrispum sp. NPDC049592 TaxID=3154835 RepID=UPI003433C7A7